jgi:hypothetical protein
MRERCVMTDLNSSSSHVCFGRDFPDRHERGKGIHLANFSLLKTFSQMERQRRASMFFLTNARALLPRGGAVSALGRINLINQSVTSARSFPHTGKG